MIVCVWSLQNQLRDETTWSRQIKQGQQANNASSVVDGGRNGGYGGMMAEVLIVFNLMMIFW